MSEFDERVYLKQVEDSVRDIRAACLGQTTPLTAVLPRRFWDQSAAAQAAQIADQLMFCLALVDMKAGPEELGHTREWLFAVALFVLEECPRSDHTFFSVLKLLRLDRGTRVELFGSYGDRTAAIRKDRNIPLRQVELAVLRLLSFHGMLRDAEERYQELVRMRH